MVEANEEHKGEAQPQDKATLPDETSLLIEFCDRKHEKINKAMLERIEWLRELKEGTSINCLKFTKFESELLLRLANGVVFDKGLKFYNDLHMQIISELEKEIARSEEEIKV